VLLIVLTVSGSAIAASRVGVVEWPVLRTLLTLMRWIIGESMIERKSTTMRYLAAGIFSMRRFSTSLAVDFDFSKAAANVSMSARKASG